MYVDLERFRHGLGALAELTKESKVRLIVGPRSLQFEIVDESALEAHGLNADELDEVADDVTDVLLAAVNRFSAEGFARRRSSQRREYPDIEPEPAEIARTKFELTTEAFDLGTLRERRWLKRTSQIDSPHALDWEIVDKAATSSTHRRDDGGPRLMIGAIRLATEGVGHSYLPEIDEITFVVDREDLDLMIDRLTAMRDAWSNLLD